MSEPRVTSVCGAERLAGGLSVALLHAAAFWGLANHRPVTPLEPTPALFVELITLSAPMLPPPAVPMTKAVPQKPAANAISEPTSQAPSMSDETPEPGTPASSSISRIADPPTPTFAGAAGPVALSGELSVACHERVAPDYPLASRRRNETGTALLNVELDEAGQILAASVLESSGFPRLDAAALAAVRRWRCTSPQRGGQAVRATARQAFKFTLQGT